MTVDWKETDLGRYILKVEQTKIRDAFSMEGKGDKDVSFISGLTKWVNENLGKCDFMWGLYTMSCFLNIRVGLLSMITILIWRSDEKQ